MSLPIYVDAYCGYRANERPRQSCVDEDVIQIEATEQQWRSPEATYFKVRTADGKCYLLRYEEAEHQWTLQSDLDGAELLARTSIELVTVESGAIHEAESRIAGCERYCLGESHLLFDSILADVLGKRGAFEFFLAEPARYPSCHKVILEKTLVEPIGGLEAEVSKLP